MPPFVRSLRLTLREGGCAARHVFDPVPSVTIGERFFAAFLRWPFS